MQDIINRTALNLDVGDDIEVFKSNIRKIMCALDMTLQEFSEYVDIPVDTMRNFLYRNQTDCKFYQVVKVAQRLGISIEELTGVTTLTDCEKSIIGKLRIMPESVSFYSEFAINYLYEKKPASKSVVLWSTDETMHVNSTVGMYDISHLGDDVFLVNLAIKVNSDIFMPYCSHYDTLLIATDRRARASDIGVYAIGSRIVLLQEIGGELRSIKDGSFRHKVDEAKYIGYVYRKERK